MSTVSSDCTVIAERPPCCLEFIPGHADHFVIGTYRLLHEDERLPNTDLDPNYEENSHGQLREGGVEMFRVLNGQIEPAGLTRTPFGILDLHFSPHQQELLATATSTGSLSLFTLDRSRSNNPSLHHSTTIQIFDHEAVATSLAWNPQGKNELCVTSSTGEVAVLHLSDASGSSIQLNMTVTLQSHSLEAWYAAYIPLSWPGNAGTLTGGDDSVIKFHPRPGQEARPWKNSKTHDAGVTAILPLPGQPNFVLTGSYDDRLRILKLSSTESLTRVEILQEIDLGGGVWRIRLIEETDGADVYTARVIICCMYNGACVVDVIQTTEGAGWELNLLARFKEHESICYGVDVSVEQTLLRSFGYKEVQIHEQPERNFAVVTCSFYDKRLCLWRY